MAAPVEAPAGERAHAVERQRRRVAVGHQRVRPVGRAAVAESHVVEPRRQRQHLDAALILHAAQRSVRLSGGPAPVSQGVPGHEPLHRPHAEQAPARRRRARQERAPVKPCLHPFLLNRSTQDAEHRVPPSGGRQNEWGRDQKSASARDARFPRRPGSKVKSPRAIVDPAQARRLESEGHQALSL